MRIYTYDIPLHPSPLPLKARQGAILETENGWGEIAPLPGFSPETLDEALASLETELTPSAHFGLACAKLPFPKAYPPVLLSALVSTLAEAKLAIHNGFRTLKIKVKSLSPEEAIDLITQIQSPALRLRIDVNRKWSVQEAERFFAKLDPTGIEYIEEPVNDSSALASLPPFPIALDETLLEEGAEKLLKKENICALVLKPTLLGSRLPHLIKLGSTRGKILSFSSSFESAIGLLHIAHLQALHAPQTAVGLDTHRSFTANFLPFPVHNGMLLDTPLPPLEKKWLSVF